VEGLLGPRSCADSIGMSIDRDDSDHTIVCTAYVGAVALPVDVFHQHTVAGPKDRFSPSLAVTSR
jgi:hypothetical protein